MSAQESTKCCPEFDPTSWDDKVVTWENKLFLQERILCFLHIPLNFGGVMKRCMAAIERAGAGTAERMVLANDNSLWGADVFVSVSKNVPGAHMATLSGTFRSRVFEGSYRNVPRWIEEMKAGMRGKGERIEKMFVYYTTCPICAKERGKNYVVILARL